MKLENQKEDNRTSVKTPEKKDTLLDERLILNMDEEAPEHVFPEPNTCSNKKGVTGIGDKKGT